MCPSFTLSFRSPSRPSHPKALLFKTMSHYASASLLAVVALTYSSQSILRCFAEAARLTDVRLTEFSLDCLTDHVLFPYGISRIRISI